MNKYRGSNFEDYLKEKDVSEEVSAGSKKRWKVLRAEASVVPEDTTKFPGDPPQRDNGFLFSLRSNTTPTECGIFLRFPCVCETRGKIHKFLKIRLTQNKNCLNFSTINASCHLFHT